MGLFDRLKQLWSESTETAREEADKAATEVKKQAVKAAANQALAAAKASVAKVGDDLAGFAERELADAQKAREGRDTAPLPGAHAADDILARVKASEVEARQSVRSAGVLGDIPLSRAERESAAREELARLKGALRRRDDED